jgi:hypothetical protein
LTPVDLIASALVDGVVLRLAVDDTLKAVGDSTAVARWVDRIKANKAAIIAALKVGAGDTAEPFDREAFEERSAIAEFDGWLTRADAESLAWQEDDMRRCTQCRNLRGEVCSIAKPEAGALVVANRGYRPVNLPCRCSGFAPKPS